MSWVSSFTGRAGGVRHRDLRLPALRYQLMTRLSRGRTKQPPPRSAVRDLSSSVLGSLDLNLTASARSSVISSAREPFCKWPANEVFKDKYEEVQSVQFFVVFDLKHIVFSDTGRISVDIKYGE